MTRGAVVRLPSPRRARGHEQQGPRYGVVVQADEFSLLSTLIIAPTSRSARATSFRPEIEILGERTKVMVEQLRAVDQQRLDAPIAYLHAEELWGVDVALGLVLGLPRPRPCL